MAMAVAEKLVNSDLACTVLFTISFAEFEKDFIVKSFFERLDDHEISKQTGMKYNNIRTYRCRLINKIKKLCKKESEEKING